MFYSWCLRLWKLLNHHRANYCKLVSFLSSFFPHNKIYLEEETDPRCIVLHKLLLLLKKLCLPLGLLFWGDWGLTLKSLGCAFILNKLPYSVKLCFPIALLYWKFFLKNKVFFPPKTSLMQWAVNYSVRQGLMHQVAMRNYS